MIRPMVPDEKDPPVPPRPRSPDAEIFRLMVERVKDYAIFLLDTNGIVKSWNEGLQRTKGYTADQIIGQHMSIFYTPEDVKAGLPQRLLEIARTIGQVENEGWRVRRDGKRFWADVVITALYDDAGKLWGFGKVTRDLTERKHAQDALSELSGRLVGLQDEERRRVVHELHDMTSPLLTSLISKLYSAREHARNNPELESLVEEALDMAEASGTMVRTVSSMLYPPLIEQSGLVPTLRWYIDTFAKRSGLQVNAALPAAMRRLPLDREVVLFRIVQEHFRASVAAGVLILRITIRVVEDVVDMLIEAIDGNLTSDLRELMAGHGESGAIIAGLRERVRQLGGSLEIDPSRNSLTLRVSLPTEGFND
jgi:PAS domain S-box-containing protein